MEEYLFFFMIVFVVGVFIGLLFQEDDIRQANPESVFYASIFRNNIDVGLLCLIGGLCTGGSIPIFIMLMNGYIVGNTIDSLIVNGNVESLITGLLPHFFIEMFGLLSFSVLGTLTGVIFLKFLKREICKINYLSMLIDASVILSVAIAALFFGAIIEDFVSRV
ncbi:stage II sporulation protein M [Bacillus pumilus]|uniref:stage II sporulation protein M n=1 Tax=Bacillus pumilus TaxID=1408 RepID=UPI00273FD5D9|nr:stage II sporulation protein M [Bacillus pumilus]WLP59381.1 stage II sporulation protein M [Bacillus pumilus]